MPPPPVRALELIRGGGRQSIFLFLSRSVSALQRAGRGSRSSPGRLALIALQTADQYEDFSLSLLPSFTFSRGRGGERGGGEEHGRNPDKMRSFGSGPVFIRQLGGIDRQRSIIFCRWGWRAALRLQSAGGASPPSRLLRPWTAASPSPGDRWHSLRPLRSRFRPPASGPS